MHYYKLIGNDFRGLYENREALEKYLKRLKELMEADEKINDVTMIKVFDNNGCEYVIPKDMKEQFDRLLEVGKQKKDFILFIETFSKYRSNLKPY